MKSPRIYFLLLVFFIFSGCSDDESANSPDASASDIDGNVYKTVTIGDQVWMAENLKTTKYSDGTDIPYIENGGDWPQIRDSRPAFTWFEYNESYKDVYGGYYNWHAVNTGKLCPTGWHVPSNQEFSILVTFLGGEEDAGINLKAKGSEYWDDWDTEPTDLVGFRAIGAGYNDWYFPGRSAYFWSSDENDQVDREDQDTKGGFLSLGTGNSAYVGYASKFRGYSVRCIKD